MNVTHYFKTPESSVLAFVGYDKDEQALGVQFSNGSTSVYRDVPKEEFLGLAATDSRGAYYNRHIKGTFDPASDETVIFAPHAIQVTDFDDAGATFRSLEGAALVTESDTVTESDDALETALAGGRFNLSFENDKVGGFFSESFTRDEAAAVYAALKPFGWTVSLDD